MDLQQGASHITFDLESTAVLFGGRGVLNLILRLSTLIFLISSARVVMAAEDCASVTKKFKMEAQSVSASTFANWMSRKGSIRYESKRMFEDAKAYYVSGNLPANFCPANCQVARRPKLIFKSVPNKFRTQYADAAKCEAAFKKTKSKPLVYTQTLEPDVEPLAEWIGEFSQGNGEAGVQLYRDCDGSCSPQFYYDIRLRRDKLEVEAAVVCGPARDKYDNTYTVEYSFIWSCEASTSS